MNYCRIQLSGDRDHKILLILFLLVLNSGWANEPTLIARRQFLTHTISGGCSYYLLGLPEGANLLAGDSSELRRVTNNLRLSFGNSSHIAYRNLMRQVNEMWRKRGVLPLNSLKHFSNNLWELLLQHNATKAIHLPSHVQLALAKKWQAGLPNTSEVLRSSRGSGTHENQPIASLPGNVPPARNLTRSELSAAIQWSAGVGDVVNTHLQRLLTGKLSGPQGKLDELILQLDSAIQKQPPLEQDSFLYFRTSVSNAMGLVVDAGFVSGYSHWEKAIQGEKPNVIWRIRIPRGNRALTLTPGTRSNPPDVLLSRGSHFRIIGEGVKEGIRIQFVEYIGP